MTNPEELLRKALRGTDTPPYPPAGDGALRMDANTNLFGVNPAVARALASPMDVAQYPTAFADDLRAALSEEYALTPDHVIVGNGSDEVFDFITKAFLEPGDVICCPTPSFVMFPFYGRVNHGRVVEVPLKDNFQPDTEAMLAAKPKLIFLASPNNPTGNVFDTVRIRTLLQRSKGLVVVDEAYVDFCTQNGVAALAKHRNLIVTRTFSKVHGLAGIRVGYAVSHDDIVDCLYRAKPPFTVSALSERIAVEALKDKAFAQECVRLVAEEKVFLAHEFRARGFTPYPTDANFVLVRAPRPVAGPLRQRGVWVRDLKDFASVSDCIRVTVGPRAANERLFAALDDVLRNPA